MMWWFLRSNKVYYLQILIYLENIKINEMKTEYKKKKILQNIQFIKMFLKYYSILKWYTILEYYTIY